MARGAEPVAAGDYSLTKGKERANWRYLFNWIWTERGEPKHRLETVLREPPLRDFGYRRMFVSPAGNGFLVTGNAYTPAYRAGTEAPLFVFCSPEGRILLDMSLPSVLSTKERRRGKCPSCDCKDVLYVFASDPKLRANGCFVALETHGTNRRIDFFLPLGVPVFDRRLFEAVLAKAEWATIPRARRRELRRSIERHVEDLRSDDASVRSRASASIVASGYLALSSLRAARTEIRSEQFAARARSIEDKLVPWKRTGLDAMRKDLGLLVSLRSYPDAHVTAAGKNRLEAILPPVRGMSASTCARWIKEHRDTLEWNSIMQRYEER